MIDSWELEDHLQHNNVFVSGIDGTPKHSDAYMTIVDFDALKKALRTKYTKEQWIEAAKGDWSGLTSVCLRIVSNYILKEFAKNSDI